MFRIPLALITSMLFSPHVAADTYPSDELILKPTPSAFSICFHGTCEETTKVSLTSQQWQQIRAIFTTPRTGKAEREQIKNAVARMERIVGKLTNTDVDKAGTFPHLGEQGQLDCIDESVNTSFYLQMMVNDGLIRSHTVEDRGHRGFFLNRWPHSTAVIRDIKTNELFAVDSWFEDNGKPPHIIPFQQWDDGWSPPGF